jgi:hypothetical protein
MPTAPIDASLAAHLDALVTQLRVFCGYRTLWLDDATGHLVHTEPDDELAGRGYRYVGTVMAPGRDELTALIAGRFYPVTPALPVAPVAHPALATPQPALC